MPKFVALKLTGEKDYWLVDLEQGVVSTMAGIAPDAFGYTTEAEKSGATFVDGVDVAVATETRDDAFAGKYDT
jgi:hypothetical protein